MAFTCAFSSGFDAGFEICVAAPPTPDPRTLSGVPSAVPRPRRRPAVREIAGVGYVSVLGAGAITADACLRGSLEQPVTLSGELVRDALRFLVGAILTGATDVLAGERATSSTAILDVNGAGILAGEHHASGIGAFTYIMRGQMHSDTRIVGLGSIKFGSAAALMHYENDEPIILAAAAQIVRRLTRRKSKA